MNKTILLLGLSLIFSTDAFSEHRHHGAHQHGVAELNIAISKQDLVIELNSPAQNILGFEHKPSTAQEKEQVSTALSKLKNANTLFSLSQQASCKIQSVEVKNPFENEDKTSIHDHNGEHHEHDKIDHHDEEHDEDSHTEEHDHDEDSHAEEHHTHTDIEITYHFFCEHPQKLEQINIHEIFSQWPGFETINSQWLSDSLQSAKQLDKNSTIIELR